MRSSKRVAFCLVAAILPAVARAEFRHALVIGNATYKSGTLAAPPRDVAAVAEALGRAGFTVTKAENLATPADVGKAVAAFGSTVPTNGTAVVYYSGSAASVLVPSGTNPPRQDVAIATVAGVPQAVHQVLGTLVQANPYGNDAPSFALPHPEGKRREPISGSRINVLILDVAVPPPPAPPQPAGAQPSPSQPAPPPEPVRVRDSLVILRPANTGAAAAPADDGGLSPLAKKLVAELGAGKPLDAVLADLSPETRSSLEPGELARLASPASRAVSPPGTLGPGSRPGDEWVDASGMVFCWCPPGSFTIGSPDGERDRQADELRAGVAFAQGYWIGKHEFCYRECVPSNVIGGGTGNHKLKPFNAAGDFAKLLAALNANAPEGWVYDLPTEAEWEYAARAGTTTAYSFGDDPAALPRHGNFADRTLRESDEMSESAKAAGQSSVHRVFNGDQQTGLYDYAHAAWSDGNAKMARVGSYPPNPWGLHDVHGNVSEKTKTIYDPIRVELPSMAPDALAAWLKEKNSRGQTLLGSAEGSVRKGGSWGSVPASCRSAFRGVRAEGYTTGVRLVLRRRDASDVPPLPVWTPIVNPTFASAAGATATPAADGTLVVSGTAVPGDVYTVTCPVPAGIEPIGVRIETLADPALPSGGPGRQANTYGQFSIAEVALAAVRGGGQPLPIEVFNDRAVGDSRTYRDLVDGKPGTAWSGQRTKNADAVILFGMPSRLGADGARWRYPADRSGPMTSLVVTIHHAKPVPSGPALGTLGKFRLSVLHDPPEAAGKGAAP